MKTTILRPLLEVALVLLVVLGALRWLTGLFTRKASTYQLSPGRQLALAFWPILAVGVGLSIVPAVALSAHGGNAFEWGLAAAFLALTLALGGPALLLHIRYSILNAATTLVFQPKENRLEVYEQNQRIAFERRHLARVERVSCRARRSFQARYDYLRLHLTDGRVITLTSLLTDLEPVATFLRSVPTERRSEAWCWV
jgi:hypothetical protein